MWTHYECFHYHAMFRYKFFPLSADMFLLSLNSKYFILYNKKDTQIASLEKEQN